LSRRRGTEYSPLLSLSISCLKTTNPRVPHTQGEVISLNLCARLKFCGVVCAYCSKLQLCRFARHANLDQGFAVLRPAVARASPWLTELQAHRQGLSYCKISLTTKASLGRPHGRATGRGGRSTINLQVTSFRGGKYKRVSIATF
jgi:hypothetical protein